MLPNVFLPKELRLIHGAGIGSWHGDCFRSGYGSVGFRVGIRRDVRERILILCFLFRSRFYLQAEGNS